MFPGAGPWCHVDSVVAAHLAAFERGRTGENYLLGSVTASYAEAIALAAELTGSKAPPALPAWLLRLVGRVGDAVSRLTGKEPDVTPEIAEICCARIQLDCSKAERELGYREVTLRQMFEDTVAWLEAEGRL